jgi:hypothetical protein
MTSLPHTGYQHLFLETLTRSIRRYRARTHELRAHAEAHTTDAARDTLLSVAGSYEKMADRLERIIAVVPGARSHPADE